MNHSLCLTLSTSGLAFSLKSTFSLASSGADKGTQAARDSALYVQVVTLNKDGSEDSFTTEFKIPLWIKVNLEFLFLPI